MPEITIKYSGTKTLKVLKTLSEYLNFTVSTPSKKEKKNSSSMVFQLYRAIVR